MTVRAGMEHPGVSRAKKTFFDSLSAGSILVLL